MNPQRGKERGNGPTFLALFVLLALAAGLIALITLVMPQALGFIAVGAGFFFFCAFHYLVWGWWFRPGMAEDEDGLLDE